MTTAAAIDATGRGGSPSIDVAVIGAGVIGVACALQLARQGLRVTVLDKQAPGLGASFGNAGHLATEQVFPIADTSIIKRLPAMLMDPLGPLRLDVRHLPRALPWFLRLLLNLRPAPFARTVAGLRMLNEHSLAAWQRVLGPIGQLRLLKEDGSLLVYERPESHGLVQALSSRFQEQGVPVEPWGREAIRLSAPQLSEHLQGGLFFPATAHMLDPYAVVCGLAAAARTLGVQFRQYEVLGGALTTTGVTLKADAGSVQARQVLIACGAHSAPLVKALTGVRLPLDTERGYHLMLPGEQDRLPFAVTSLERRFIMTPMNKGLRLAGTVEFAGLKQPARMARAWQLHRLSQGLFKKALSTEGATPWMGCRPSLPDSLPVIDQVENGRVLLAFGHQHLGLTQAAITAELIAQLATANAPSAQLPDTVPYRLARF